MVAALHGARVAVVGGGHKDSEGEGGDGDEAGEHDVQTRWSRGESGVQGKWKRRVRLTAVTSPPRMPETLNASGGA